MVLTHVVSLLKTQDQFYQAGPTGEAFRLQQAGESAEAKRRS